MHQIVLLCAFGIAVGTLLTPVQIFVLVLPVLALTLFALAFMYFPILRLQLPRRRGPWRYRLSTLAALLAGMLAALLYGSIWLQANLDHRLPLDMDRTKATLNLRVLDVAEREQGVRLIVQVLPAEQAPAMAGPEAVVANPFPALRRLQLGWYRPAFEPRSGMLLNADVVLRSPRAFANRLPFDYEAFLLSSAIDGGGYIRSARVLDEGRPSLREQWLGGQRQQHSEAAWPWLAGLVFGEQQAFSAEQWRLAQHTGTLHLLVVSGLHVGMVAALGWLLALAVIRLWILLSGRGLRHPALVRLLLVGAVSGGYVWLAGTGIALQRAWIMIMVLLWLFFSGWRLNWLSALSLALLLVLLLNPLIWTRAGFGFSFIAVLSLLAFFNGRTNGRLQALVLPQWVVFVTMLPLLWFWGLPVSLMQVWTNLLAIPLLSLLILPLALLDVSLAWLGAVFVSADVFSAAQHAALVGMLDGLLATAGEYFWQLLQVLQQQRWPMQFWQPWPVLLFWPALLLLWRLGVSAALSWGAMLLLVLALFWSQSSAPTYREQAIMLDVGQGQSLVFITNHHVLVYDTGARFSAHFDAGSALLLPLLKQAGVTQIDTLLVSHSDIDHAGGLDSVLRGELPVRQLLLGQMLASVLSWRGSATSWRELVVCRTLAEAGWQEMDAALRYRILALPAPRLTQVADSDNNQSCVVQLDWFDRRFLLTGDIERDLEQQLVAHFGADLRSDVLVLAHHGSRSSSSSVFLEAVQPAQVWISAGFNNRFGHPHADVISRLNALNIPWYLTARDGALLMASDGQLTTARSGWQPPWRQP